MSKRLYLFVHQTSCTSFLQTGTFNSSSNYSGCFPKSPPPRFSQHRNSFREVFHKTSCSAKWCDKMSFFCANGQKQQSVTCKFTKKCAVLQYFSRNLATSSEQRYGNINLDGCFWGQMFFEIIPEWLVHKGNWVDVFIFKVLMFTHILPSLSWCYVRGTNFCGFF